MTKIELTTAIKGSIDSVFDLSRDISFHMESASQSGEKAIEGVTSGLINLNETVRWKGKHFGLWLTHTSKIVKMEKPHCFVDLMIRGHFTYFVHKHEFEQCGDHVIMKDELLYKVPYGWFGKLFDKLLLKNHLRHFLKQRNAQIKSQIENEAVNALVDDELLRHASTSA
ncbi:SRPBCC family protein [Gilvibacter sediminis]|uniref:SRPBCC family protein n=1 Tax=Gilvibacter sediminis TaxID=379071 RepID=UPI00235016A3|nr:SRPBCC family protein [Gilvibacter sediminis]MDC7997591.1 SRPBCC family protein [Gilvibacter sediminis]